ncbi:MAG: thioredoxin domain-containing protein [Desulfobacterales bacterium]|nr:thioredoxin domain-containing protein [Desulfobacterales bacterium]
MLFRIVRLLCIIFVFAAAGPGLVKAGFRVEHLQTLATGTVPLDIVIPANGKYIFVLAKGGRVDVLGPDGRLLGKITVAAGVDGIEASPDGTILFLRDRRAKNIQVMAVGYVAEIDTANAPFLGRPGAPVTVTVFSDFQCPFCARLAPILKQVQERYPDQVKVVFKNFPLTKHEYAFSAAASAMAAHNQGRFWEFHDALFIEPDGLDAEKILAIARDLHLDMDRFLRDRASDSIRRQVQQDKEEGERDGVGATPSVFVNGQRVRRLTLKGLEQAVSRELARIDKQD